MEDPILKHHAQKRAERLRNNISTRLKHIAKRVERELADLQLPGEDPPIFALFVYMAGAAQYIGNGNRDDIKQVTASVIARWDDPNYASMHKPAHEKTAEEFAREQEDPL